MVFFFLIKMKPNISNAQRSSCFVLIKDILIPNGCFILCLTDVLNDFLYTHCIQAKTKVIFFFSQERNNQYVKK